MKRLSCSAVIFTLVLQTTVSFGAKLEGKEFDEAYRYEKEVMALKGLALKRFLFARLFVAGFYLSDGVSSDQALSDVAKRIEVAYFQNIPALRLAKETRRLMKLNTTKKEFVQLKERVDVMDGYFRNIKPGDRYSLTYIPGIGTKFIYNDELIGIIEGYDFAKGLFAVWVGQKPINRSLKAKMLGLL